MKTVVSRERARATWLTGAAGLLILGTALAMMVVAAPSATHPLPHHAAAQAVTQAMPDSERQLTARTDSTTVRACRAGPSAVSAWAEAYTPSMITESWSATSSGRATRPPLANSAVS
jgi:hypothetical protein